MRTRLLQAALDVLQRDGASGLTVRNVTAAAGCSTTGIYTYFGGKHGLVEALYLDGFRSFDRAVSALLDADRLEDAGREYRRWALANPTHYLVMFGRVVPDFVPSPAAMEEAARSFDALVRAVARAGAGDRPRLRDARTGGDGRTPERGSRRALRARARLRHVGRSPWTMTFRRWRVSGAAGAHLCCRCCGSSTHPRHADHSA
jgi:AcrR family transcriptional regulator